MEWWSGGVMEWLECWSGGVLRVRVVQNLDARSTLRHQSHHSTTPSLHSLHHSVTPIHLVQKRVFVDIPLWQANLFLSVSSAAPGFPFRRLDWAVWGCLSPMAQRMKPNRYGF